jgi:hypothetical protein
MRHQHKPAERENFVCENGRYPEKLPPCQFSKAATMTVTVSHWRRFSFCWRVLTHEKKTKAGSDCAGLV